MGRIGIGQRAQSAGVHGGSGGTVAPPRRTPVDAVARAHTGVDQEPAAGHPTSVTSQKGPSPLNRSPGPGAEVAWDTAGRPKGHTTAPDRGRCRRREAATELAPAFLNRLGRFCDEKAPLGLRSSQGADVRRTTRLRIIVSEYGTQHG